MIQYQDNIVGKVKAMCIKDFPHSLILYGERGSGKTLLAKYIYECMHQQVPSIEMRFIDCSDKNVFNSEFINDLYLNQLPCIHVMNARDMSPRGRLYPQELLLKVLEEPPVNIYFIIEVDDITQLLDTITNRCVIWKLNKYTPEQLKTFGENIEYCNTPGDVLKLKDVDIDSLKRTINTIINKLSTASYASILKISDKFRDTTEQGKSVWNVFLFDLFMTCFDDTLCSLCKSDISYSNTYTLTHDFIYNYKIQKNCNIERLFKSYLIQLKGALNDIRRT